MEADVFKRFGLHPNLPGNPANLSIPFFPGRAHLARKSNATSRQD